PAGLARSLSEDRGSRVERVPGRNRVTASGLRSECAHSSPRARWLRCRCPQPPNANRGCGTAPPGWPGSAGEPRDHAGAVRAAGQPKGRRGPGWVSYTPEVEPSRGPFRANDHVGHDPLGRLATEPHLAAKQLPYEQVGRHDHRDDPSVSLIPADALHEGAEGALHPAAMPSTSLLKHLVYGGDPLFLCVQAEPGIAVTLVGVIEQTDCGADIVRRSCISPRSLGSHSPRPRFDEQRLLGPEMSVECLNRYARFVRDVAEPHLLERSPGKLPPGRRKEPLPRLRSCLRPRHHPVSA